MLSFTIIVGMSLSLKLLFKFRVFGWFMCVLVVINIEVAKNLSNKIESPHSLLLRMTCLRFPCFLRKLLKS